MRSLILASQSPRRADLLTQMGFNFTIIAADVDESALINERPRQLVSRLAQLKAQTISKRSNNDILNQNVVLAADTIVVINEKVLGKPSDFDHFYRMMQALSGATHTVMTAISICDSNTIKSQLVCTEVTFCKLDDADIQRYWDSGEPSDKAGGYGIQAIGGQFVTAINGSYSAVVGLPMVETRELLAEFGVVQ